MSRGLKQYMGALDKMKDSEEIVDAPCKQERWFKGGSRDLFDAGPAVKQSGVSELSRERTGSDSRQDNSVRIEDLRFDGRDAAMQNFVLDTESRSLADEIGRGLAEHVPKQNWENGDIAERVRLCDGAYRVITDHSSMDAPPPTPEFDLSHESLGFTQGREVHYNIEQLADPSPQPIIETLSHEYRHVWQQDVVSGRTQHPLGSTGKEWLSDGYRRYGHDTDDFEDYACNPLELDSEAFAREVSTAYNRENDKGR